MRYLLPGLSADASTTRTLLVAVGWGHAVAAVLSAAGAVFLLWGLQASIRTGPAPDAGGLGVVVIVPALAAAWMGWSAVGIYLASASPRFGGGLSRSDVRARGALWTVVTVVISVPLLPGAAIFLPLAVLIDILPRLKARESRPGVGYCGLRRGLFSRCETSTL